MVGDRASHDGGGIDLGVMNVLVPSLRDVAERRLDTVMRLTAPPAGA